MHDQLVGLEARANYYITLGLFCGYETDTAAQEYEESFTDSMDIISELARDASLTSADWLSETREPRQGIMSDVGWEEACVVSLRVIDLERRQRVEIQLSQLLGLSKLDHNFLNPFVVSWLFQRDTNDFWYNEQHGTKAPPLFLRWIPGRW